MSSIYNKRYTPFFTYLDNFYNEYYPLQNLENVFIEPQSIKNTLYDKSNRLYNTACFYGISRLIPSFTRDNAVLSKIEKLDVVHIGGIMSCQKED